MESVESKPYFLSVPLRYAEYMLREHGVVIENPGDISIRVSPKAFLMGTNVVGVTRVDSYKSLMSLRATPDFNSQPEFDHVLFKEKGVTGHDNYMIGQVRVLFSVSSLPPPVPVSSVDMELAWRNASTQTAEEAAAASRATAAAAAASVNAHALGVGVKMALVHMYGRYMPSVTEIQDGPQLMDYIAEYQGKLQISCPNTEENAAPTACMQLRKFPAGVDVATRVIPLSSVVQEVLVLPHYGEAKDRFLVNRWLFRKQ